MSESLSSNSAKAVAAVTAYLEDFLLDPQAFRGQQLRGGGPVAEFERTLADRCGFPYCVATCNATAALLGLAELFRVSGKTIWFPKSHWEGSVSAFRLMGARIRRYVEQGDSLLRGHDQTSIVIASEHADANLIRQRAESPQCTIIEDSARLPGWTTSTTSQADIQVLSFGPGKPLSLGEGGAILFRTKKLYLSFVSLAMHPERIAAEGEAAPRFPRACLNARIHPVAAIIGSAILAEGREGFISNDDFCA